MEAIARWQVTITSREEVFTISGSYGNHPSSCNIKGKIKEKGREGYLLRGS
jgi:hypothetical protein